MLDELAVDYIDLVLLHSPMGLRGLLLGLERSFENFPDCKTAKECWEGSWKALGEAREQGKVLDIGVSNFNQDHLEILLSLPSVQKHPVAVNQIAFNPWYEEYDSPCLYQ